MSFKNAVNAIASIAKGYENGLQALGAHSNKIIPTQTRKCTGSVNLDLALVKTHAKDSRWDYALGYNKEAYFVEVHPASGEVTTMIKKAEWLRSWLKGDGRPLMEIHHKEKNFHWIPTGGVSIIGKERIRLAQNKIVVVGRLSLK